MEYSINFVDVIHMYAVSAIFVLLELPPWCRYTFVVHLPTMPSWLLRECLVLESGLMYFSSFVLYAWWAKK